MLGLSLKRLQIELEAFLTDQIQRKREKRRKKEEKETKKEKEEQGKEQW